MGTIIKKDQQAVSDGSCGKKCIAYVGGKITGLKEARHYLKRLNNG